MADVRSAARYPDVAERAGHYESFYLKACHPEEPRALWIRHTVFKRPGEAPVGSLWCTLFDAAWDRPAAFKETLGPDALGVRDDEYLHVGATRLAPGIAEGPAWRLGFQGDSESFAYLPRPWMYRARLPRT